MAADDGRKPDSLNFAGTVPPQVDNGLHALLPAMISGEQTFGYAVVRWHARHVHLDREDMSNKVIVEWKAVSPVFDDDARVAMTLMDEEQAARANVMPQGDGDPEGLEARRAEVRDQ